MANFQFNIAKGRTIAYAANVNGNTPANSALEIVILKTSEADDTLNNYTTLSALLAGSNTEADATAYARKVLTDTDSITITVDNTANTVTLDIPDQVWTTIGGTLDNTTTDLLVCYNPDTTSGVDTATIPLLCYDFVATTNGNNLTAEINASGLLSI